MALVITAVVHRDLAFRDRMNEPERLFHGRSRQRISGRIASHPYFLAAIGSKWVTDVNVIDTETQEVVTFDEYRAKQATAAKQRKSSPAR